MVAFKRLRTAVVAGLIVVLAGCQSSGGMGGSGSVDPRLANNQDVEFFNKSGVMACAGGALLGALACAASNSSNKAVCMIAAAVAGCGVGVGANAYLDNQRKKICLAGGAVERLHSRYPGGKHPHPECD